MIPLKFDFKQIADLNEDLKKSPKAVTQIARRVMAGVLAKLRKELRPQIPAQTGKMRRTLGVASRIKNGVATAQFGFMAGKRTSASTVIASNVFIHPGAQARKREFLWVPVGANRSPLGGAVVTPQDFFNLPATFVRDTPSGNRVAFRRVNESIIPLFVLKKTVRFAAPPIGHIEKAIGKLPEITDGIEEAVVDVIAAKKKFEEAIKGA